MQKFIVPKPLSNGGYIRVIAPSCSGKTLKPEWIKTAEETLSKAGFKISFGKNVFKQNQFQSSDRVLRLKDLHEAFSDPNVNGILAIRGGYNANDLLDYIDWKLIKNNPKVYCGFSDNTALQNAILAQTGLVTYSGPNFSTFGNSKQLKYTLENFLNAVSDDFDLPTKNDGKIVIINKGKAKGALVGGNLCTFNLLQGTKYMPDISGKVLFFEDDHVSDIDLWEFHRNLQSIINLSNFSTVAAIVFGKFEPASKLSPGIIGQIIKSKSELDRMPVIANVTFGHALPMLTIPIGGQATVDTSKIQALQIANR
jgi:muramoyltetrapeptide carboxypeptidase LdcA involved in peptidoglycan recycling